MTFSTLDVWLFIRGLFLKTTLYYVSRHEKIKHFVISKLVYYTEDKEIYDKLKMNSLSNILCTFQTL